MKDMIIGLSLMWLLPSSIIFVKEIYVLHEENKKLKSLIRDLYDIL